MNICTVALVCAVCMVAAAACDGMGERDSETDEHAAGRAETLAVTGLITNVEARSLLEIRSITVVAERGGGAITLYADGQADGGGFGHFSPSHAREHMIQGLPVRVRYQWDGDAATVVGMEDAAAGE